MKETQKRKRRPTWFMQEIWQKETDALLNYADKLKEAKALHADCMASLSRLAQYDGGRV